MSRLSQEYLDSLRQQLLTDDFGGASSSGGNVVNSIKAFVKKYYIHIIIAIVVIVLIAYYASPKVASFASISGNEEEDTGYWENTYYNVPASPFEPSESIKA